MSKITLELSDEAERKLNELAKEEGLSQVEIIRRALTLYSFAQQQKTKQRKLSITDQQDKVLTNIVFE